MWPHRLPMWRPRTPLLQFRSSMWPTRSLVGNSTHDLDVHKTNLDGHMSNINVLIGLSDGHNGSSDVHLGLSDGQNDELDAHNGVRVRHCLAALGQTMRRRSQLATRTASPGTPKQCHAGSYSRITPGHPAFPVEIQPRTWCRESHTVQGSDTSECVFIRV